MRVNFKMIKCMVRVSFTIQMVESTMVNSIKTRSTGREHFIFRMVRYIRVSFKTGR